MNKILIASSSISLSHSVRGMALAKLITSHNPEASVTQLVSTGHARLAAHCAHAILPCLTPSEVPARDGKFRFNRFWPIALKNDLIHALQVVRFVREHRPDLVILDELQAAVFALKLFGVPVVWMAESFSQSDPVGGTWGVRRTPLITWLMERLADRCVILKDEEQISDTGWRRWARRHAICTGPDLHRWGNNEAQMETLRRRYEGRTLITVTVGGSDAGEGLLVNAVEAFSQIRRRVPEVAMVLICGSHIDPGRIASHDFLAADRNHGLEIIGFTPQLPAYLAVSQVVICLASRGTLEEAARSGVPTLVVPLPGHEEQQINAEQFSQLDPIRLLDPADLSPERLGDAVVRIIKGRKKGVGKKQESDTQKKADNKNGVQRFLGELDRLLGMKSY